jgi:feruloyl esterase
LEDRAHAAAFETAGWGIAMTRISRARFLTVASVLGLLAAGGLLNNSERAIAADTGAHDDAASCQALAGKTIASGITVTTAEYNAGGATVGRSKVPVPFCRIAGVAAPTSDSHIGFELWLPPATSWNGKYQQVGSGSSAGSIGTAAMLTPLEAGYATLATDNGHVTDPAAPNGANEQGWALGHPEKMVDFAWRAVHVASVAAKDIVEKFYGHRPSQSYFVGCSTGGRQALMEATRFPDDFNGIVAGAPAWHWTNQMINATWNSEAALKDPSAITEASVAILNRAVMKQCDALDGVEDGVISDPRRCNFDPKSLECKAGDTGGQCLTPVQVDAAARIYNGAHKSDGTRIFQGYAPGSELNWPRIWAGAQPGGSSWDFWRYSVLQDKSFTNTSFDFDKDTDRVLGARLLNTTISDSYDVKPDLVAFEKRGGKLIMFHGWADQQISPYASVDFYNKVVARIGKPDAFYRLFMLPGIAHCSGGPGVGNIGDSSPALQHDPQHDLVEAIDTWVTKDQAPTILIGSRLTTAKTVDRTRPLCPYPQEARYKGAGDTNDAASFICADPGKLPPGPM